MNQTRGFPLFIVCGLSGAGKSTALNVFEDMRCFVVDGLPPSLAPKVLSLFQEGLRKTNYRGLALGMDVPRQEDVEQWGEAIDELEGVGVHPRVIFVEARNDVLLRRYATTRRPHPLESEGLGLEQALDRERELLTPFRKRAELVVDTSGYSIHDLRRKIQEHWDALGDKAAGLRVHIITFGFKYGVPLEAELVFDLRFLPNPYFDAELRPLSGKDEAVARYVYGGEPGKTFLERYKEFLAYLLPLYEQEGRYRITLAIGCTGGRHRSVSVAEAVHEHLKSLGYSVSLEHRHLELG